MARANSKIAKLGLCKLHKALCLKDLLGIARARNNPGKHQGTGSLADQGLA